MSEPLDILAARAVFAARRLERAIHDPGPWTIRYAGVAAPAVRLITEAEVIFRAHFPDACWMDPSQTMELRCREDLISTRMLLQPDDGEFSVTWSITIPDPSPVAT